MSPNPERKVVLAFERGDIYTSEESQIQRASINIVAGCILLVGVVVGIERGLDAIQNMIKAEYSEGRLQLPVTQQPKTGSTVSITPKPTFEQILGNR